MSNLDTFRIRPAGRHVLTIGQDLIQDRVAALVELVKNAYDADSDRVTIRFRSNDARDRVEIVVEDHGHGMSREDVIDRWLVPSTDYKLRNRLSPHGRVMQGRKGIGRYAASILGDDLLMETVDAKGVKTSLYVDWQQFERTDYLDQVEVLVESRQTDEPSGTCLIMNGSANEYDAWAGHLKKLRFELKKLIPPKADDMYDDTFCIILEFDNFFRDLEENRAEEIVAYPILDLFDYRINGQVDPNGCGKFKYCSQKARNAVEESIGMEFGPTMCGNLIIDIRVYDRDRDAIDQLIDRGLKDEFSGDYVSKLEARRLLNEVNGIGVYRNGFRIRPLGDADFDWLRLNERRIQNPSLRVGSNQVVGYVHIGSEELSHLEEKSARDGLKDNDAFRRLKEIVQSVLNELERKRFQYRRKVGLSSSRGRIQRELEALYDYSTLKRSVSNSLRRSGLSEGVISEVADLITQEEQAKNATVEEIKQTVAVYQGQATLGKIINIILHEGRRPLNYFRNQIPNLRYYSEKLALRSDEASREKVLSLSAGIEDNAAVFSNLFGRLDPLAAKRRETRSSFLIAEAVRGAASVFENEIKLRNISLTIDCDENTEFVGWKQDFYTIFANLIDNSIFWIDEKGCTVRTIAIIVTPFGDRWQIDYLDSGPGIEPDLLESEVIFDPQFTTKPNGTGLGLSIAGEAAQRNGLILTAVQNEAGAHFRLLWE